MTVDCVRWEATDRIRQAWNKNLLPRQTLVHSLLQLTPLLVSLRILASTAHSEIGPSGHGPDVHGPWRGAAPRRRATSGVALGRQICHLPSLPTARGLPPPRKQGGARQREAEPGRPPPPSSLAGGERRSRAGSSCPLL